MWRLIKFLFTGDFHVCRFKKISKHGGVTSSGTRTGWYEIRECECGNKKYFEYGP